MNAEVHIPAKTKLECAIQRYEDHISLTGKNITPEQQRHLDIERMYVQNLAQITERLEEYYGIVDNPKYNLETDDKHQSQRLGENMRAVGRAKPTERYDAHAIVSGTHINAAIPRLILAEYRVGLDDPDNGVWLPRSGNDSRKSLCWATPGAVPHSRTHRKSYYFWVRQLLTPLTSRRLVKEKLRNIGDRLAKGKVDKKILDEMKYDDLQSS